MWGLNYKGSTYIQGEGYSILSGDHGILAEDSDQMGLSSVSGQYECVLCMWEIVKFYLVMLQFSIAVKQIISNFMA